MIRVETKPVSVNSAYPTNRQGIRFLTKEGKAYKNEIAWAAKSAYPEPLTGQLKAIYRFGFADKRRRDVDDYIKLTQDALVGICFDDDSQIIQLEAEKVNSDIYFVEIEINKI